MQDLLQNTGPMIVIRRRRLTTGYDHQTLEQEVRSAAKHCRRKLGVSSHDAGANANMSQNTKLQRAGDSSRQTARSFRRVQNRSIPSVCEMDVYKGCEAWTCGNRCVRWICKRVRELCKIDV